MRINIREYSSTYIARGGKKTASCTMGRRAAAEALARKVYGLGKYRIKCIGIEPAKPRGFKTIYAVTQI